MNKLLQLYWVRMSAKSLHPLQSTQYLLAYQSQLCNTMRFSYSYYDRDQDNDRSRNDRGDRQERGYGQNRGNSYDRNKRVYSTFRQPRTEDIPTTIEKNMLSVYRQTAPSPQAIKDFFKAHKVTVQGGEQHDLIQAFNELSLPEAIKDVLEENKFITPTPIQQVAIPYALTGGDLINIAQTGSGKTLSFILPSILHLLRQKGKQNPRILVLAPTRELAVQIQTQYDLFSSVINTVCVYGGAPKWQQQRKLQRENDVIIATPGRLLDFVSEGLSLSTITQVIIDEADRMLDMGFEPQLRDILKNVRQDRQTLFFSATWPEDVRHLAEDICQQNPQLVQIGQESINLDIKQEITIVNQHQKDSHFIKLVKAQNQNSKVLVFCQRKNDTQRIEQLIEDQGISAASLHGDLQQNQRDDRVRRFKNGDIQFLIATNLASRGLDISDIDLVINYDFPENIEDYIHRIGRTGRAGKKGTAISLIHSEQKYGGRKLLNDLIRILRKSEQPVTQQLLNLAKGY